MAYNQILADDTGREHIIEIKNLNKSFDGTKVLKDITFYIRNNEFITLLGPSGCGKSTTLRIIAGFETADSGIVNFEGNNLLTVPAHKRNLNTVFQRYALFPHLNVFDNVAFGLKIKKIDKKEIEERVNKALTTVGLAGFGERYVDQISGGQMQRVAIARAIVNRPKVLLLDEPLGALDLKMRKEMQIELKQMQRELGITFVYVTHDQEEALTMSDTIIVMKSGEIAGHYAAVVKAFDELLEQHGYRRREDGVYEVVEHNDDVLVFFCHFGITALLTGYLTGIAPPVLWQGFFMAPTSVTILGSEERIPGEAAFRVQVFGDARHLTEAGEPLSPSGYFTDMCEG